MVDGCPWTWPPCASRASTIACCRCRVPLRPLEVEKHQSTRRTLSPLSARTLVHARPQHHGRPSRAPAATAIPCLRLPFARMNHLTIFLTSCCTSRAHSLAASVTGAPPPPARPPTGRLRRGRAAADRLTPLLSHPWVRNGTAVLVPPFNAAPPPPESRPAGRPSRSLHSSACCSEVEDGSVPMTSGPHLKEQYHIKSTDFLLSCKI
jgi:hypothetical protein